MPVKIHVRQYYEKLYCRAGGKKPPVLGGKPLALDLGYPAPLVDLVPDELWEDFLPCGYPLPLLRPAHGERVLNLGCGAGVDSLVLMRAMGGWISRSDRKPVAARRSQSPVQGIVNLDVVLPLLLRASAAARRSLPGAPISWVRADAEALPFSAGSFKWAILNGVLNLFEDKSNLINELRRVIEPGGGVAGADLCITSPLPDYFRDEPDAWAWCMSGALTGDGLAAAFASAGFEKIAFTSEKLDEFFDRATFAFERT